jgi:GntR family transcriptional repressor for pyruvate dehydrogenase complex
MAKTGLRGRDAGGSLPYFVTEQLRRRIASGQIRPGEQLPTERALITEFGVSRTVIREAIAGLRADGLVKARQGAGVFVLPASETPGGLSRLQLNFQRISSIIEALELRAAVEIEAAALAAMRSSPAQQMRISEALEDISAAVDRGERGEAADFAFHLSIANATNNKLFADFLEFLGERTIPRAQIADLGAVSAEYLRGIQAEHRDIVAAISKGDPEAAKAAMRSHLQGSQERYHSLRQAAPAEHSS